MLNIYLNMSYAPSIYSVDCFVRTRFCINE